VPPVTRRRGVGLCEGLAPRRRAWLVPFSTASPSFNLVVGDLLVDLHIVLLFEVVITHMTLDVQKIVIIKVGNASTAKEPATERWAQTRTETPAK
jgi:hypothetical protein